VRGRQKAFDSPHSANARVPLQTVIPQVQNPRDSRAEVEVEIEYLRRRLRLVVRDNGIGIDPQTLHSGKNLHWGLTGMRERAASIGAKTWVWRKNGRGTEVEIS
jgi:nitrate/nitrite-specific signal transduction histidine kinase